MRAVVWPQRGEEMSVQEVTLRDPRPDEVVIANKAANVCWTDAMFMRGPSADRFPKLETPQIPGHGTSSVVEAVGSSVTHLKPGDRVVAGATSFCGACYFCLRDHGELCRLIGERVLDERGRTADGRPVACHANVGGFAEYSVVPANQVVRLETDVPDDQIAVLSIGLVAGLGGALISAPIWPGADVAIFGCGQCGLGYVQGARIAGARRIIGVEPVAERRELALKLGATDVLDPGEGDVVEQIKALTDDHGGFAGHGVDFAYEASAEESVIPLAYASVRGPGTLVMASVQRDFDATTTLPAASLAMDGKTIVASQHGSINIFRDFPRFVEMIERGVVDAGSMVSGHYTLEQVDEALDAVDAFRAVGPVLVP